MMIFLEILPFPKVLFLYGQLPILNNQNGVSRNFLLWSTNKSFIKLAREEAPLALIWPLQLSKLIAPVPPMVQNIHYLDYCDYNRIGEAFIKSQRYLDFQNDEQHNNNLFIQGNCWQKYGFSEYRLWIV